MDDVPARDDVTGGNCLKTTPGIWADIDGIRPAPGRRGETAYCLGLRTALRTGTQGAARSGNDGRSMSRSSYCDRNPFRPDEPGLPG